jgi:subtilisin family serine protease
MTWSRLWRLLALVLATFAASSFAPVMAADRPVASSDRQILVMINHPPDHYRANGAYGGGYGDELARSARDRAARVIAHKYGLTFVEEWPMPMIGVDCFVMVVPDGRSTNAVAEQISHDADVSWAEPVELYTSRGGAVQTFPNDPLFGAEPATAQWRLADLHRMASGRGTRVAVVDSGIDERHPALAGQIAVNRNFVSGQPFVAEQHGTAVAGIIAAKGNNPAGVVGVAPNTKLLGLRACSQSRASTTCDTLSLAKALYFAVENRADIINLSLSGPDARLLREILKIAYVRGTTVVAAFDPKLSGGGFPASVPGVIAVADAPVAGPHGEVYLAPGRDVPTTEPGGRWFLVNGSSFAAAHVSGLVALIRERRRSAPLIFISQGRGGPIDACATLVRAIGACECTCNSGRSAVAGGHR